MRVSKNKPGITGKQKDARSEEDMHNDGRDISADTNAVFSSP